MLTMPTIDKNPTQHISATAPRRRRGKSQATTQDGLIAFNERPARLSDDLQVLTDEMPAISASPAADTPSAAPSSEQEAAKGSLQENQIEWITLLEQDNAQLNKDLKAAAAKVEALEVDLAIREEELANLREENRRLNNNIGGLKHNMQHLALSARSRKDCQTSQELQDAFIQVVKGYPTPVDSLRLLEGVFFKRK